jgi:aspartate carbamoyltransferase regulatory subunit
MKELKVTPIKNGTVIDHIDPGMALKVLKIIGVTGEGVSSTVSVVMHVHSSVGGWKDIVKVEDRELLPSEVDKITLISPNVTINIIRNYKVVEKYKPTLPEVITGLVRCNNPNCISNQEREPVESKFSVISKVPPKVRCLYCGRITEKVADRLL